MSTWDVFLSYRWTHRTLVHALADALKAVDLNVWLDAPGIDGGASIPNGIEEGLAHSALFVAVYSHDYLDSPAANYELRATLARLRDDDPSERMLIVLPPGVSTLDHVRPTALRNLKALPLEPSKLHDLAVAIAGRVRSRAVRPAPPEPAWVPSRRAGSSRFVGRELELWDLHDALTSDGPSLSQLVAVGVVQVRGIGGVGKTLLVEHYARSFGRFWPGGIFWLPGSGSPADALRLVAPHLGVDASLDPSDLVPAIARKLLDRGPYLWVVDDLPHGSDPRELPARCAPTPSGRTVVTTRDRGHDSFGRILDVSDLEPAAATRLLCWRRQPEDALEAEAAAEIVHELANHPLAVDVTAGRLPYVLGRRPFATTLDELRADDDDALELAAALSSELPGGYVKSIARTLLISIRALGDEGRDLLRAASGMARIGFPTDFVASVFARVHDGVTAPRRRVLLELALSQAHTASLADPSTGPDTWRVHDLVSRTVRFHDPLPARREFVVRAVCDELLARFSAAPHRFDARADQDLFHHARYATRSVVDDTGARLALLVGDKEREHADYEHAFASFARVAAHCDEVPAVGAPQLKLSALAGIARLLAAVGDGARAVPLHQQVLAARMAALGETHVDTLSSMHELAESMLRFQPSAGYAVSALAHLAMERREEQLGANHRDTLSSRLLFARASRVPGSEHLSLLREVQVLGALEKCGEMPTAELTGLQVEVSRKFRRDGHLQDARSMAERALEAQESRYGRDHPTTGRILAELAAIVLELGDFRQSRELADEAHRVLAATLGAEHPDAHAAAGWWTVPLPGGFSQLGATFVRVPDCPYLFDPELFEWANGAPVTLQDVLGDDPDRMEDIAVGRLGFGDYLSARYFYARTFLAFARRDDLGWLTSFRGVMMLHNFATTLYLSGDLLQGRDLSMYVASGLRLGNLLQGRDLSMYVASGLRHEAELHVSRCQLALDADHGAHDRRELAIFERATDGWSLLAIEARAMTAFASGRHEDGLRGMMEVVSAKAAMLGIRNFDRLRSVARYADMLVALGRVGDAAPLVQTNLMRWRQQCGSQHPEARWTMRRHARCLELQGRTEDAELCARAAAAGAASDSGPGFAAAMAEHCPAEVLARMGLAGETPR